jgi:hypothetical protein
MKRRRLAALFFASIAGVAGRATARGSSSRGSSLPTSPQTPAESAVNVSPKDGTFPEMDLRRYGYTGGGLRSSRTDTDAFNAALAVAQYVSSDKKNASGGNSKIVFPANSVFHPSSGLRWDFNRISVDLNGGTIDFAMVKIGSAISPLNTLAGPNLQNLRPLLNICHPLENGYLIGPGVSHTESRCFEFADSADSNISSLKFRNLGIRDFATDVYFGSGSFCTLFESCNFTLTEGEATTYSVIQSKYPGEKQTFIDCQWFNKQLLISNMAGPADLYFIACSFDYFTRAFTCSGGGSISVIGGHMESNTDIDVWGCTSNADSALMLIGSQITLTGNKVAFDMFRSDASCTHGGVSIHDCIAGFGGHAFDTHFIGGGGRGRVDNLIQSAGDHHPAMAAGLSLIAYGGFEESLYSNDWVFGGTVQPIRTAECSHQGTHSLKLAFTAGHERSRLTAIRGCTPGRNLQGEFWWYAPAITDTGYTLLCEVAYLDNAGGHIELTTIMIATQSSRTWTRRGFSARIPAPAGTVAASISFSAYGVKSGSAASYLDDIILNLC